MMLRSQALDTVPTSTNAIQQPLFHKLFCYGDPPPTNYIPTFIKPFSLVWYVIPLLKTGFLASTCDLFLRFWWWKHKKNRWSHDPIMLSGIILTRWWRPVASSEALNLLHWAMHAVMYRRIASHGHQNGQLCRCICWLLFVCLLPWQPLGRYGASSCLMPASSGFWNSPRHAPSGDAICIAPACRRGHQNIRRMRCIYLPPPPFLFAVIVA